MSTKRNGRNKPTICQVLHTMNVGGAEILARQFAYRSQDQFRTVFACLEERGSMADELENAGFVVEVLERRPGFDFRCARRFSTLFRTYNVALVHAHQYAPFFYSAVGRAIGRRVPILFTEHGRAFPDFPRRKRMIANRFLLRSCDRVVAVGNNVRQALINNEGFGEQRVEVVYNGIDLSTYSIQSSIRDEVRRELGLDDDTIAIIQVARLDYLKDHATAIRAMAELVKSTGNAKLILVGEGPEREMIEQLVSELGLAKHVQLLGLRTDVPRLLQAADIFLLSSISEGIPLTMIEAMAVAVPCVSTCVGGIPEVIEDDVSGLLAESGNPQQLAAQLLKVVGDESLRHQLGEAGRERAVKLFDERQMHDEYHRIYHEMIKRDRQKQSGHEVDHAAR